MKAYLPHPFTILTGAIFGLSFGLAVAKSQNEVKPKTQPEYHGIDRRAQYLINEYTLLSSEKHLYFPGNITLGFKDVNVGRVIGVCHWGDEFREIDLDNAFWNRSTDISRRSLVFHELTHCLCGRDHTYGKNVPYPDSLVSKILENIDLKVFQASRGGYFRDSCPLSIMHPIIISDECMAHHEAHYLDEMFNSCKPWKGKE